MEEGNVFVNIVLKWNGKDGYKRNKTAKQSKKRGSSKF